MRRRLPWGRGASLLALRQAVESKAGVADESADDPIFTASPKPQPPLCELSSRATLRVPVRSSRSPGVPFLIGSTTNAYSGDFRVEALSMNGEKKARDPAT